MKKSKLSLLRHSSAIHSLTSHGYTKPKHRIEQSHSRKRVIRIFVSCDDTSRLYVEGRFVRFILRCFIWTVSSSNVRNGRFETRRSTLSKTFEFGGFPAAGCKFVKQTLRVHRSRTAPLLGANNRRTFRHGDWFYGSFFIYTHICCLYRLSRKVWSDLQLDVWANFMLLRSDSYYFIARGLLCLREIVSCHVR